MAGRPTKSCNQLFDISFRYHIPRESGFGFIDKKRTRVSFFQHHLVCRGVRLCPAGRTRKPHLNARAKDRGDIIHRQRAATAAKRAELIGNARRELAAATKLLLGRYTTLSQTR